MRLPIAGARVGLGLALTASLLVVVDGTSQVQATAPAAPRDPGVVARDYLAAHATEHGLTDADARDLRVSSVVPSDGLGTIVYLQQTVGGIDVAESLVNVLVGDDGTVAHVASSALKSAAHRVNTDDAALTDVAAARSAARALDLDVTEPLRSGDRPEGDALARELGDGGISTDPIPVNLVYQGTDAGGLRLAWQLVISPEDEAHMWQVRVDAVTGRELARQDWVTHESYTVLPTPVEAPSFGARQTVTNPADAAASPLGWVNATNLTTGNNVHAYTDTDSDNRPDAGSEPTGGAGHDFSFPLDLAQAPSTYRPAAVTNLFYVSNRLHDVLHHYGFDEAAGNFQVTNYSGTGAGGDAVLAEAADGGDMNNANFATPPDGRAPRMQMYLWDQTAPMRDGSFDNGIIAHEYGHGVSNRLTGGPANVDCLGNEEQPGEGWSDFLSYVLTMPTGTVSEPAAGRGMGTYALGQAPSGRGIRSQRYSRNPAINSMSYDDIKAAFDNDGDVLPHDVGEVWAQMLWQLTWDLVKEHGYDADIVNGSGGNNRALQLVMDGLKLQPCSPGFVDARDAILAADRARYGGADQCLIWRSFAADGLGYSARQGSSGLIDDGAEALDLPPACAGLELTSSTTPAQPVAGQVLTHHVTLRNTSGAPLSNATALARLDADATYVDASATCGGSYSAGDRTVTFRADALAAGASLGCSYRVAVTGPASKVGFQDDFETSLGAWRISHDLHPGAAYDYVAADWSRAPGAGVGGGASAHASEPSQGSDQWLTTVAPIAVPAAATLAFDQRLGMEIANQDIAYDGGQVLVSTNGGASWAQPPFTQHGPEHDVAVFGGADAAWNSVIAGQKVISGGTDGWVRSSADLSAYAGRSVLLAFRLVSDSAVGGAGWWVDNVAVGELHDLDQEVTYSAAGAGTWTSKATARIVAPAVTPPPATPVTPTTPVVPPAVVAPAAPRVTKPRVQGTAVRVRIVPGAAGSSPVTRYAVRCVPIGKGRVRSASGSRPALTVRGLTAGRTYRCRATATSAVGTSPAGPWSAKIKVRRRR